MKPINYKTTSSDPLTFNFLTVIHRAPDPSDDKSKYKFDSNKDKYKFIFNEKSSPSSLKNSYASQVAQRNRKKWKKP